MRKRTVWTTVYCCILLPFMLHAQDKLCLENEIRQVKVTELSPSSVHYVTAENPTQTNEIPLSQVLILVNVQGSYIIPGLLDTTSPQAITCLNHFFSIGSDDRTTDELITKQHKVLDVAISNEDDQFVYYGNNEKISKDELAAIIYQNGEPKFLCPMVQAAAVLGTCLSNALNLMNPPGTTTNNRPAGKTPTTIISKPSSAAATATSTTPAAKPAPTHYATKSVTIDPDLSDDSLASRKIDSLLGGHHITRKLFAEKCTQKTHQFTDYLYILCDKTSNQEDLDKATKGALQLFVNEDAIIEVSTNGREHDKSYKVKLYLNNLRVLPYDRIDVQWVNFQYVENLKLNKDGNLEGTVSFEQIFRAYKDNAMVYSDVTTKTANVILKTYDVAINGTKTKDWEVLLTEVGVFNTKSL